MAAPPATAAALSRANGSSQDVLAPLPGDARATGAHVLVANLLAQGVRRVFLIPGAKVAARGAAAYLPVRGAASLRAPRPPAPGLTHPRRPLQTPAPRGAQIDRIIEVLRETPEIELVLCRNEMTAGFMAAGEGGSPGGWARAAASAAGSRRPGAQRQRRQGGGARATHLLLSHAPRPAPQATAAARGAPASCSSPRAPA
jgi:hypothetical protein